MKRIIPCLDIKDNRVVKGVNFVDLKDAGDPVEIAKAYAKAGADELVFLDISATNEDRPTIVDLIKELAENIDIPFTVGGGIRSIEDCQKILDIGADKISIGSSAIENEKIISEIVNKFTSKKLVIAIDVKKNKDGKSWNVFKNGGRIDTGIDAIDWARKVESLGAGEILLTSMDGDGMKTGYDIELTRAVAEAVSIPVVASGGAGSKEDFYQALTFGKADAALAASLFHFKEIEICDLKKYLKENGVEVRLCQQ